MFRRGKKIRLLTATAFAVGAMIGGGVFVLTGTALQQAGPAALVAFLIAGLTVLLSALSFAVIASQAEAKKSGYTFAGKMLGSPAWSFLISWCFYLSGIIAAAFVLNAFGIYVQHFIVHNSSALMWALISAGILTLVNLGPASEIGKIETFLVGGKLVVLLLLICFGIAHLHATNLHPFNPHGSSHIFTTSAFLFIAFLGFNVITNISGDIENPRRTVPRAILLSMLVVTFIYLGVVLSLLAAHISTYSEASVGVAAQHLIGPVGGMLIVAGALISTLSSANANILGSSEIIVRLAADKSVPTALGRMRNGHPYTSVFFGAVLYFILILTGRTDVIVDLANVTAIVALIIVNVAAARALTLTTYTGFRLPLGWFLPILGAIGALLQFAFMPISSLIIGLALSIGGVAIYALRRRYHYPQTHKEIVRIVNATNGPLSRSLLR